MADEGISGWADLSLPPVVQAFVDNPQNVILGAVLSGILEAMFGVLSQLVDIVLLVVGGSRPGQLNAPGETLGVADVPVAIAEDIGGVAGSAGTAIIVTIRSFNGAIFEAAGALGPLSPVVIAAFVAAEIIVLIVVLRRIVYIVADLLQLGGLTE